LWREGWKERKYSSQFLIIWCLRLDVFVNSEALLLLLNAAVLGCLVILLEYGLPCLGSNLLWPKAWLGTLSSWFRQVVRFKLVVPRYSFPSSLSSRMEGSDENLTPKLLERLWIQGDELSRVIVFHTLRDCIVINTEARHVENL
jgi:hypothetical protein